MTASDAPERVLADMRRRLGDDPDAAAIREAATEAVSDGDDSDRSLDGTDVDALVTAYRERFVTDDVPADRAEAAADDIGAADHSEEVPSSAGTNEGETGAGGGDETRRANVSEEVPRRIHRVAHFRDTVRTAGEWTVTTGRIGPGLFDVASDARTTEGMSERLDAHFGDVDYEVRSYTLGPDDRHPSWTQILLSEPVDPSRLPEDLTIRKVEDYP